jgi:hypothetical protein
MPGRRTLENHVDFDGWQYLSQIIGQRPDADPKRQAGGLFRFVSGFAGARCRGNIKPRNEWLHTVNWDLVVFDEYHFGAWRDTARSCSRARTMASPRKRPSWNTPKSWRRERRPERAVGTREAEFLPITTRAYLYLSGTPFKALATGEFIEEQIFNWTYTDEQRAKAGVCAGTRASATPMARCRRCAC